MKAESKDKRKKIIRKLAMETKQIKKQRRKTNVKQQRKYIQGKKKIRIKMLGT